MDSNKIVSGNITSGDGNAAIGDGNEEEDLLAIALGSSTTMIQNTDTYEESVIRNAELSATPRLMALSSAASESNAQDEIILGFPPLQRLVPSRNIHADLTHVQKVLQKLRRRSSSSSSSSSGTTQNQDREKSAGLLTNTKDCMKEQILLSLLNSVDHEMGIFPQQEAKQEWKRRKLYRDGTNDVTSITNKRKQAVSRNQGGKQDNNDNNDIEIDNDTPTGRLEAIKKGRQKKISVRFSSDIPVSKTPKISRSLISKKAIMQSTSSNSNQKSKRRRISMQERRRNQNNGVVADDDSDNDECDHAFDEEEKKLYKTKKRVVSQLKQLRIEREERRKSRNRVWRDGDDDDDAIHNDNTDEDDNDNDAEFEFDGDQQQETNLPEQVASASLTPQPTIPVIKKEDIDEEIEDDASVVFKREACTSLTTLSTQNSTAVASTAAAAAAAATTISESTSDFVVCPLCEEKVLVLSQEVVKSEPIDIDGNDQYDRNTINTKNSDAVLARHMDTCQTKRGKRGRRQREDVPTSSTLTQYNRRERKKRPRPNYAEVDISDEDDEETDGNFVFDDKKMKSKSTQDGHQTMINSDDKTSDDQKNESGNASNDDDFDEDLIDTDMDDDDKEIISAKPTTKKRRRGVTTATATPSKASISIDDWDEDFYEDRVDDWIDNGLENMPVMKERDVDEIPPGEEEYDGGLIVPAWINDRLFPYQRTGLQWMWELHRQQAGGILGDEMGLGKTIQVASFLGSMAASRKLKAILIISPATLLQHWLKEMKRWAPGVRRFLIHQSGDTLSTTTQLGGHRIITPQRLSIAEQWLKKSRRNRLFEIIDEEDLDTRDPSTFCGTAYVFVTTFENVRRNEDIYMNHRWSYVVIDEAQKIRNPNAYITLACKKFKTPHRLALSGTPIQNDLRELWSIFDFVFPGRLGTLPAFETEFATPIKKGGYSNASPMQVQLSYRCALILKDLINPYLLRRLKKDIKEVQRMPGKKEQVLFCRLSDCQRSMYEAFLQSDLVKKVFRGSAQLLGAITTLRKICNHPDLVSPPDEFASDPFSESILGNFNDSLRVRESDNYGSDDDDTSQKVGDGTVDRYHELIERSGKLEILAKILPLWKKQGHRVLIFCQWRKMLDIIMDFVKSNGWKFSRLDGNTNVASRQRLVDTFNSDESYFGMLCTTRTGGVGLNLVGADRVILYDPDWNPQTDAQARERAWRFGQVREVTVYRMICAGTVEEKIYQRQIFKTALSNSVLQDSKQRRLFTHKDLKDLFSLKADNGSVATGAEGITETAELTKGDGYVDPDDNEITANAKEQDNGETMQSVLKSRGLAGIFDHDVVEGNWKSKRASVREMEAKAKKLSREALQNLRQSVAPVNNLGSRFGSSGARSNSILSSIAERNTEILNAGTLSSADEIKQNTQLLKDLRNFVKTRVPTTNELLVSLPSIIFLFSLVPVPPILSLSNHICLLRLKHLGFITGYVFLACDVFGCSCVQKTPEVDCYS